MEYQKNKNLLKITPKQPSKFRTKNWIEINDDEHGIYNTKIKLKTTMLKSSLCHFSNAYILVKRTITVVVAGADDAAGANETNNKPAIFNN